MARRAARNGAMLGGNDAELNDLVAALESEDEERAAATEQHDKKPAAKQFALRMLAGCIVLRVRSIAADQYTIKGRFARIPRVSPMISPKMRNLPSNPRPNPCMWRQTSTVRAPCCMAGWSSRFLRTSTRPNAGFRVFLAYLSMISPRILNLPSKPRPKPRLWREMAPKPRLLSAIDELQPSAGTHG